MIFDHKTKTRLGVMCFTPVACFFICFVYYLLLIVPLPAARMAAADVGVLSAHYDTLFIMLAASAIITAPIFIYCLVILARLRSLNSAQKLEWIIFLSVLAPIASMFFWVFLIRGVSKYQPIYPDIA